MNLQQIARERPLRIVVDRSIPYIHLGMPDGVEVTFLPSEEITRQSISHADVLMIRSVTHCDATLLEGSSVQLITTATAGFEHIDRDYCQVHGIVWRNAPGCNAASVAQYVLTAIAHHALSIGEVSPVNFTLGIVGVGHTGGRVYQRAKALGMEVLLCDPPLVDTYDAHRDHWSEYLKSLDDRGMPRPYLADELSQIRRQFVSMETIARRANLITLHVPLTKQGNAATYHIVDRAWLSGCERNPFLINACRGAVIDTTAVVEALDRGRLSGATIDCWEGEPHISPDLLRRVEIATPHIAGFSVHGKSQGAVQSLTHLCHYSGLSDDYLSLATPTPPVDPIIDLSQYPAEEAVWHAMLATLPLEEIKARLVDDPEQFEKQRVDYHHPFEPRDYQIHGAPIHLRSALEALGFSVVPDLVQ